MPAPTRVTKLYPLVVHTGTTATIEQTVDHTAATQAPTAYTLY